MDEDNIEYIMNKLAFHFDELNKTPQSALDDLSPLDISKTLYHPFRRYSPVQYAKNISDETLQKIPFYMVFRAYLERIQAAGEIKLTPKGYLPRKLCLELYALGIIKEEHINKSIKKLNKEQESVVLQNLKKTGNDSGLTKKKNNTIRLTHSGIQLLDKDHSIDLFKKIFETNVFEFNLGYHAGYSLIDTQGLFGYTLYLLLKYGKEKRLAHFYSYKTLKAFPQSPGALLLPEGRTPEDMFHSCFEVRFFERLLQFYGFVNIDKKIIPNQFRHTVEVQSTPLLQSVFYIDEEKMLYMKPAHR